MRAITFLAAIGALSLCAVAAQADDETVSDACAAVQAGAGQAVGADGSPIDLALCESEGSTNLTTVTTGNVKQTVGQVDGEPVNVVSSDLGNVSVTTGQVGGEPVSLTTVEVGNVTITTGQAGGKSVNTTTVKIGTVEHKIELPGN